jgi:hypothetical protein
MHATNHVDVLRLGNEEGGGSGSNDEETFEPRGAQWRTIT